MDNFKVSVWKEADGSWCYAIEGDGKVYVYGTKRSVMNAVERALDAHYGMVNKGE